MGRWSEGIFGGDEALQWRENIYNFCNANEYSEDGNIQAISIEDLSFKVEGIVNLINSSDTNEEDKNIGFQVLAAIVMNSGFDFDCEEGLKDRVLLSIDEDAWSKDNGLRKNLLKNYKKIIKTYNYSEPIDIEKVNLFEEIEGGDDEDDIAKEFKEVFGMLNGRIKKINSMIEEASGNKDYDDGYKLAANEEIDFLNDFKELLSKQEMMGILLEKINKGLNDSSETKMSQSIAVSGSEPTWENAAAEISSGGVYTDGAPSESQWSTPASGGGRDEGQG